jgi:hypothetical protein
MRGKSVLLIVTCLLLAQPSGAACHEDTIDTISEDGDLIVLSSGP